jgi:hypothetical protein
MTDTTVTNLSNTLKDAIKRRVCLKGLAPVMFDRYPGDNSTQLEWWQKVYQQPGTSIVSLPTMNVVSLLSSHNTNSAPKRLRDKRKYKDIANACLSFVMIDAPSAEYVQFIPFLRDGKPVEMGAVGQLDRDPVSGIFLHTAVARLDKGIPNPKKRPVLPLPWSLEFDLTILPNREIKEQEVRNLMAEAGMAIGLGTFRGVFGKFIIDKWA